MSSSPAFFENQEHLPDHFKSTDNHGVDEPAHSKFEDPEFANIFESPTDQQALHVFLKDDELRMKFPKKNNGAESFEEGSTSQSMGPAQFPLTGNGIEPKRSVHRSDEEYLPEDSISKKIECWENKEKTASITRQNERSKRDRRVVSEGKPVDERKRSIEEQLHKEKTAFEATKDLGVSRSGLSATTEEDCISPIAEEVKPDRTHTSTTNEKTRVSRQHVSKRPEAFGRATRKSRLHRSDNGNTKKASKATQKARAPHSRSFASRTKYADQRLHDLVIFAPEFSQTETNPKPFGIAKISLRPSLSQIVELVAPSATAINFPNSIIIAVTDERINDEWKNCVWISDLRTSEWIAEFPFHGTAKVTAIATHPNYPFVVSGDETGTVMIWDPSLLTSQLVFENADAFADNDSRTEHSICSIQIIPRKSVDSNSARSNGSAPIHFEIVIGSLKTKLITVLSGDTFECLTQFKTNHRDHMITATALEKDWNNTPAENISIVTSSWDKSFRVWKLALDQNKSFHDADSCEVNGSLLHDMPCDHGKVITAVIAFVVEREFQHDAEALRTTFTNEKIPNPVSTKRSLQLLITAGLDKICTIWDAENYKMIRKLVGHSDRISRIRVCDNKEKNGNSSPFIITASDDKTCIFWDMATGQKLRVLQHETQVMAMDILNLKEGFMVVTGDYYGTIKVWNLSSTQRCYQLETGGDFLSIDSFEGNGDGRFQKKLHIAVGATDGLVRFYDLENVEQRSSEGNIISSSGSPPNMKLLEPLCALSVSGQSFLTEVDELNQRREELCVYCSIVVHFTARSYLITGDDQAQIIIWDLQNFRKAYELEFYSEAVRALAVFDKSLSNVRDKNRTLPAKMLIGGDADGKVAIWDLGKIVGEEHLDAKIIKPIFADDKEHQFAVRSISVHHSKFKKGRNWFATGSYDKTVVVWCLHNRIPLCRFQGFHPDIIYALLLYDPTIRYTGKEYDFIREEQRDLPWIITGGFDGYVNILYLPQWFPTQIQETPTETWKCRSVTRFNDGDNYSVDHKDRDHYRFKAHDDRLTSMKLYVERGSKLGPLLLTGSADSSIIIWNLSEREMLRRLGHTDEVCFVHITQNQLDGQLLVVSGAKDQSIIVWEDALHDDMPASDSVRSSFMSDLKKKDWPLMALLAKRFQHALFVENSYLFELAMQEARSDFLLKFRDYLTYMIRYCPVLLGIAIEKKDITSVRAILLSWQDALNTDISNMLDQRVFHPMFYFKMNDLRHLAKAYPMDFMHFICGLKLIRNDPSLLGDESKKISMIDGIELIPTHDPSQRYSCRKYVYPPPSFLWLVFAWSIALKKMRKTFKDATLGDVDGSVTSFIVPLCNVDTLEILRLFVEVSEKLNRTDIFDSPVGEIPGLYYWELNGRNVHYCSFAAYLATLVLFMNCLGIFRQLGDGHRTRLSGQSELPCSIVVIILFTLYLCAEARQFYAKFYSMKKQPQSEKENLAHIDSSSVINSGAGLYLFRNGCGKISTVLLKYFKNFLRFCCFICVHFATDVWNSLDLFISVFGITGLLMGIGSNNEGSDGERIMLSITSVLMWFKLLYFWRADSTAGPMVVMVVRVTWSIRYFIILLFCVIIGFAQAFWVLSSMDEQSFFGTVGNSLWNTFMIMLSPDTPDFGDGVASPKFMKFLIFVFMIILVVVMLNTLIAFLSNNVSELQSTGLAVWRKELASICIEEEHIEFVFSLGQKPSIPPYIHVLQSTPDLASRGNTKPLWDSLYMDKSLTSSLNPEEIEKEVKRMKIDDGDVDGFIN